MARKWMNDQTANNQPIKIKLTRNNSFRILKKKIEINVYDEQTVDIDVSVSI